MIRWLGALAIAAAAGLGRTARLAFRAALRLPRMSVHELLRSLVHFGYETLPLCLIVAAITGATAVLQTTIAVGRLGARGLLGWAAGFAVLWEFGPLVLSLMLAARVGARNAAELATLRVGGQLEGLAGVALDPYALLVAPRVVGLVVASVFLAFVTFLVAIVLEAAAAYATMRIPTGAFYQSFSGLLSTRDLAAGMTKVTAFAAAIAIISTGSGIEARGGARGVGQAVASSVVQSSAAIFVLDFALTPLIDRVFG